MQNDNTIGDLVGFLGLIGLGWHLVEAVDGPEWADENYFKAGDKVSISQGLEMGIGFRWLLKKISKCLSDEE
jgi:hypothetical protein